MKKNFDVTNMTCAACAASVKHAVETLKGVAKADVRLLSNDMTVEYDEERVGEEAIIKAASRAGFPATMQDNDRSRRERERRERINKELRSLRKRFFVSAVLLFPLLYVSTSGLTGLTVFWWLEAGHIGRAVFQAVLSLTICAVNFRCFTDGFSTLFRLRPNMNSLVSLGCVASLIFSFVRTFSGEYAMLYFESAGTILTLVTLGKLLEARSKRSTNTAVTRLLDLSPKTVTVVRDGVPTVIKAEDIVVGDIISVRAGESLAADGVVVSGGSEIDASSITGEHEPVYVTAGDRVMTSSKNVSGLFEYRAEKVGEDTVLAEIVALVEQAGGSKPPIARFADRVSLFFVPAVLGISLLTAVIWLLIGNPSEAFENAVSVLVISCPCALGLATPISVMAGTGKGAELGILFKSAEAIETLCKCDVAVLDKTGTVTEGRPAVCTVIPASGFTENDVLYVASGLEGVSTHPLAQAITDAARGRVSIPQSEDAVYIAGKGAAGMIDGEYCTAGNAAFTEENGVAVSEGFTADGGRSSVTVTRGGVFIGTIQTEDKLRPSSAEGIGALKKNMTVLMVTGDAENAASAVAATLGIEYRAGVLPGGKEGIISALRADGKHVMMIGDGINDAPALAAADVGIAIGAGSFAAIDTADAVLASNDLRTAATATSLSHAVIRNIKENLFWALIYNCIGIPLAAGALSFVGISLTPVYAAAAMSASSVCVCLNSLRLKRFGK